MATATTITLDGVDYKVLLHSYRPWLAKGERVTRTAGGVHDVVFPSASESGWNMVLKVDYDELALLLTSYAKKSTVEFMPFVPESPTILQSHTSYDTYLPLGLSYIKLAVQLTCSASARLTTVELRMHKASNTGGLPPGNVRAVLYSDSSGLPGTVLVNSGWVDADSIAAENEWVEFTFSTVPAVVNTTIYHVGLEGDASYVADEDNYVAWEAETKGSGGTAEWYIESWANVATRSLPFRLNGAAADDVILLGELSEQTLIPILDGSSSLYHVPIRILRKNA